MKTAHTDASGHAFETWPKVSQGNVIDVSNAPRKKALVSAQNHGGKSIRVYVLDMQSKVSIEYVVWDGKMWVMKVNDNDFGGPTVHDKKTIAYVTKRIMDAIHENFMQSLRNNQPQLGLETHTK